MNSYHDRHNVTLLELMRGEMAAAEAHYAVIHRLGEAPLEITAAFQSHANRVDALAHRLQELGQSPPLRSGSPGLVARLAVAAAGLLGRRALLAVLRQIEELRLSAYYHCARELDSRSRSLVERYLLPEQRGTHRALGGNAPEIA